MASGYCRVCSCFHLPHTSSHLHPLQVENCDNNSRLVVDEDGNGKFMIEIVKHLRQKESREGNLGHVIQSFLLVVCQQLVGKTINAKYSKNGSETSLPVYACERDIIYQRAFCILVSGSFKLTRLWQTTRKKTLIKQGPRSLSLLSKHQRITECLCNVEPPSATLAQHCTDIGSTSLVCRVSVWLWASREQFFFFSSLKIQQLKYYHHFWWSIHQWIRIVNINNPVNAVMCWLLSTLLWSINVWNVTRK